MQSCSVRQNARPVPASSDKPPPARCRKSQHQRPAQHTHQGEHGIAQHQRAHQNNHHPEGQYRRIKGQHEFGIGARMRKPLLAITGDTAANTATGAKFITIDGNANMRCENISRLRKNSSALKLQMRPGQAKEHGKHNDLQHLVVAIAAIMLDRKHMVQKISQWVPRCGQPRYPPMRQAPQG